jgi:hypothetical protein
MFDPFGNFQTHGYLQNFAKEKDLDIVRRLEHTSFLTGIDTALDRLAEGYLDRYLLSFVRQAVPINRLAEEITRAPGLDGNDGRNRVLGKTSDPAVLMRYKQQELKRRGGSSF